MKSSRFSLANAFPLVLLLGLLGMTARPMLDPDLWWHLRTGQWIVQTGHVPHVDPFSFTRAGQAWVSHEWLSEVVFYELWKRGGAIAPIVFSAVITSIGFMLLYLRCPGKKHWAVAVTALGALASAASWGVRPQMFTFAMASLLLWLVEAGEKRPTLLLWIPPLFLLWLNLHAGYALGPALLLAYGVGLLIESAVGETSWHQVRPIFLRVILVVVACMALVPLNPSGAQLYSYPLETLRSAGMRSFIVEWFSPDFHQSFYWPFLIVWLLLLAALGSGRARPKGRVIVPLILTAFAALDAVRHIPIFGLLAIPVIASALPSAPALSATIRLRLRSPQMQHSFAAVIVILMAVFAVVKWTSLSRNQSVREAEQYPQSAVEFLRSNPQAGRVLAYYDWGGYSIWKLYPEYRVFVDGRADLYGDSLLRQFKTALELRPGWHAVLDDWNIGTILLPPSCALAQALLLDNHWRTVFSDSKAIVMTRTAMAAQPPNLPLFAAERAKR